MNNGLICGTNNNICRINEYGISSCCDNYRCIRPDGNYQYKICVDKDKLFNSNLSTNLNINIPSINVQTQNNDSDNIKFPSIQSINLSNAGDIPIFTKDFWTNMFDFNFCPARKNIYKNNLLEEEEVLS